MNQQLDLFSEYKDKLVGFVSAGNSDFLQKYFINIRPKKLYTISQFSQIVCVGAPDQIHSGLNYLPKNIVLSLLFDLSINVSKGIDNSIGLIKEKSNHCFFSLFLFSIETILFL